MSKDSTAKLYFHKFLFVFTIILSTNPIAPVFFEDRDNFSEIAWYFIYISTASLAYKSKVKIKVDILVLLVVITCVISIAWSSQEFITFKRAIALSFSTIVILYLIQVFKNRELLRLMSISFAIIVTMNVVASLFFQSYVYDYFNDPTALRGVYTTKNHLSKLMVLSIITIYFYIRYNHLNINKRCIWIIYIIASFILMILSKSAMTIIVTFILIISILIVKLIPKNIYLRLSLTLFLFISFMSIILIVVNISNEILGVLGKDSELSGRMGIWSSVYDSIQNSMLLGYGYAGFWGGIGTPSESVVRSIGWNVPSAHNGYLEIWLSIGLIGLILILVCILYTSIRLLNNIANSYFHSYLIITLIYLLLINLTESSLLLSNNLYWFMFIIIVTKSKEFNSKNETLWVQKSNIKNLT